MKTKNQINHQRPRSQLNLLLLVILAVLLIAASIVLIITLPHAQTPVATESNVTVPAQLTGFKVEPAEAQQYYPLAGSLIRVSKDRITGLNLNGGESFAQEVSLNSPLVVQKAERMLVVDREGLNYALVSTQGIITSGSAANVIRGAALAGDGHFALITEPSGSTGVVSIYTIDGQWLFDCLFPDSGFVLGVAFTSDSLHFDVSLLNTDGSAIYPLLKRFTIAGEQTGQRELSEPAIMPLIVYDAAQEPVLCGSSELIAVSYKKDEPLYNYTFPLINTVTAAEKGLVVLNSDISGGHQRLTFCPPGGEARYTLEIGETAASIEIRGSMALIANGTRIVLINLNEGKIVSEQNLAVEIVRAAFINEKTITAVTRSGVRQLAIPEK